MSPATLIITVAVTLFRAYFAQAGEPFVWTYRGTVIGRLTVPPGFAAGTYNYREGIVTTLRYGDGASIVLQVGGMYRRPMLRDPEHELLSDAAQAGKTIRKGRFKNSGQCWREDNFKAKKITGRTIEWLALFPPQVAYVRVTQARQGEFDRALDSFVREIERNPH